MRRGWLLVLALAVAGCTSSNATATIGAGPVVAGHGVSRQWTPQMLDQARAWLAQHPGYHRKHWHNGVLLTSTVDSGGGWHGLVAIFDGSVQALGGLDRGESTNLALLAPGDAIEYHYSYQDQLSATDVNVLVPNAVRP